MLVHFGSRSHSVYREEKNLLGFDNVDELVDRTHDGGPEFLKIVEFADAFVAFGVVAVDCIVNDAVKIEVQVVYLC